ncbi:MAG: SOS response-associated peptidase, partial [Candidatus Limnocylindrus sp.]
MCGRIVQSSSPEEIAREFGAAIDPVMRGTWQPHWNVAPTATAALIAPHAEVEDANGTVVHERLLTYARWGLVPHWAKDESLGNRLFNARAETVETLPSFRDAFKRGRVIVPIDAFYEWENPEHLEALGTPIPKKAPKQPWAFLPANGAHFALAGLASIRVGTNGAPLRTFTLITTEANAVVGRIHDRMPV